MKMRKILKILKFKILKILKKRDLDKNLNIFKDNKIEIINHS